MKTAVAFAVFALFVGFMVLCELWGRITGKPGQAIPNHDED
jgi:hypothetical protein